MPAGRRLLSRRTTLTAGAGAAGLALVTGCDDDREPGTTPTPATDPDGDLVDSVLAALADAAALVARAGARFPKLEDRMTDLRALHDAHIEALEGTPPTTAAHRGDLTDADAALTAVRGQERRLRSLLVESAVSARSGALARLLASMSAAVTQHLTTLPGAVA